MSGAADRVAAKQIVDEAAEIAANEILLEAERIAAQRDVNIAARMAADKVTHDAGSVMYLAGVLETYMKENNENMKGIFDTQKTIAANLVEITAFTKVQAETNKTIFKKFEDISKAEADCKNEMNPRLEMVEAAESSRQAIGKWWKTAIVTGASAAGGIGAIAGVLRLLGVIGGVEGGQ